MEQTRDRVHRLIKEVAGLSAVDQLADDVKLRNGLRFDSLDVIDLIFKIEHEFPGMTVSTKKFAGTDPSVADVVKIIDEESAAALLRG